MAKYNHPVRADIFIVGDTIASIDPCNAGEPWRRTLMLSSMRLIA
jgi:hypothetical protein